MARRLKSPGVSVRKYASGRQAIQLYFTYRNVECREIMQGLNPEKVTDWNHAVHTLTRIKSDISRDTFDYCDYFPDSKKAELFGHARKRRTVGQYAAEWLADVERSKEAATIRKYKSAWRFWSDHIADLPIADLKASTIRDLLRAKPMALKTIRGKLIPLRAIIQDALADEVITHNPLAGIKPSMLVDKAKRPAPKEQPFSSDEIEAILSTLSERRPEWFNYFAFTMFTGCRTGEVNGLLWSDVDWLTGSVMIQRAIVERKAKDSTKTESGTRLHKLHPVALSALKAQRAVTQLADGAVFLDPATGRPVDNYEHSNVAFTSVQKLAGVHRRTQYTMRHTYCSHMLLAGVNPLTVAGNLGHKNMEMVIKNYARYMEQGQDAPSTWFVDFRIDAPHFLHVQSTRNEKG